MKTIIILALTIVGIIPVTVSISMQVVYGQGQTSSSNTQSSDKFLTWTNDEFTIDYPEDWETDEEDKESDDYVSFIIRLHPEDDVTLLGDVTIEGKAFVQVSVEEVESKLDTNTMTLQNKSLEEYIFIPRGAEIIREGSIDIAGTTGWKTEYTSDSDNYIFQILTIDNGKLYKIKYVEKPLKVPETLPLFNKMVESFQIK